MSTRTSFRLPPGRRGRTSLPLALLAFGLGGCTTVEQTFDGHETGRVWSALVQAAENPIYLDVEPSRRWFVRENNVWVDEDRWRIEIDRSVHRRRVLENANERYERRDWRLRVTLEETDAGPRASLGSLQWMIPAHVWDEAARYFDDVWRLLGDVEHQEHDELIDALGLDEDRPVDDGEVLDGMIRELDELLGEYP
ncbi:MAG: hypothetical protein ACYTGC_02345 [Planctomycetota bacterium]|jgi:hypothetical protein